MCHHHQIMLTPSLYGSIGGRLIGHFVYLNYHQKSVYQNILKLMDLYMNGTLLHARKRDSPNGTTTD